MGEDYYKAFAFLYAAAAMISVFHPVRAELLLILIGGLLAFPIIAAKIFSKFAGAQLILFVFLVLGLMIPVLQFMVAIVGVLLLFMRLHAIARAMPIVIAGLILHLTLRYGFLYVSEHLLGDPQGWGLWLLSSLYGLVAWSLFNYVVSVAVTRGREATLAAAMLVGWPVYCILIILTFMIPGPIGDLTDG